MKMIHAMKGLKPFVIVPLDKRVKRKGPRADQYLLYNMATGKTLMFSSSYDACFLQARRIYLNERKARLKRTQAACTN